MASSVTYTATLKARRETVQYLAALLHARRVEVGTRAGTRALGPFEQAVMVIRWFLDGTRVAGLGDDNHIARSTAYDYLHEGIDVLAAKAPGLDAALATARAAGCAHLNLDGTVIRTDRIAALGPDGAGLWWSGKHKHHGGNVQVLSDPDSKPPPPTVSRP